MTEMADSCIKDDGKQIKMSPNAATIDEINMHLGIQPNKRKLLNNPNLWHKFKVINMKNAVCRKNFILSAILDNVHPLDFIPVRFKAQGNVATFFARNCRLAVEKLFNQKLIVPNPENPQEPIRLRIILGFTNTSELHINVQDNITNVLKKRYINGTKTLNLEAFHLDGNLSEFCTLSQQKIFNFVLHLSKQTFQITTLKLANNGIYILKPLEALWGINTLTSLDLRKNKISDVNELGTLKNMQITDLALDGNPVCDMFDEHTYVQALKEMCPRLEKLDGILLGKDGFMSYRRNFVCSEDGQELVDQFLEHYFTLYDSPDRGVLDGLYHSNAMFSMTCSYIPGQNSFATANLGRYKSISRNLLLLSDMARCEEYLECGSQKIIQTLKSLPQTEHDPYTFTVDLVYHSESTSVLTVTGIFREVATSLLEAERIMGFVRTFVLSQVGNSEIHITNEQAHITNATNVQSKRAFKVSRIPNLIQFGIDLPKNDQDKSDLEKSFCTISNLNPEWSKKCLDECKYDFRKALSLFVDLYKVDKIPEEAFMK